MHPSPCRVVVVVSPRLLGDSLTRSMRSQGAEVTAIIDDVSVTLELTQREFDVAVVSESLPTGVTSDVVLHLPDADSTESRLQVGEAELRFPFTDVPSLLDLVHRFCAHPVLRSR